jgi:hypothetical protein
MYTYLGLYVNAREAAAAALRTFGDIDDTSRPWAVLMHGYPETPHTCRHLGPELGQHGYRVVAPPLQATTCPSGNRSASETYACAVLDVGQAPTLNSSTA